MTATGSMSCHQVAHVIGLCQAASEMLPLGRLRPLQWAAALWFQPNSLWDLHVPMREDFRQALHPWGDLTWLHSRVPIRPTTPTVSICTDSSLGGWGACLLPEFDVASGLWMMTESSRHINELEMLAILRALQRWLPPLTDTWWLIGNREEFVLSGSETATPRRELGGRIPYSLLRQGKERSSESEPLISPDRHMS